MWGQIWLAVRRALMGAGGCCRWSRASIAG